MLSERPSVHTCAQGGEGGIPPNEKFYWPPPRGKFGPYVVKKKQIFLPPPPPADRTLHMYASVRLSISVHT